METYLNALKPSGRDDEFFTLHPEARETANWFDSIGAEPARP